MNKVFIIFTEGEDGNYISGVFLNKELAKMYYTEHCMEEDQYRNHKIEEHEIVITHKIDESGFYIKMDKAGNIISISKVEDEYLETERGYFKMIFENKSILMKGVFTGKNKKEAIEKAHLKRLELMKARDWCIRE